MPRLFAGIEIPEATRGTLARLKMPLPGAKWVEPETFHITLRFAGDIDNRQADEFASALGAIDASAFSIRISDLGAFGGNEPRSLWAGVDPSRELEALQRATERAARNAGLAAEPRAFKPHVTLARLKHTRSDAVARFLERKATFQCEPFAVSRFVLFSSKPVSGGGPYVVEEAYPLAGGGMHAFADFDGAW
jgi:2'-5' RNA ligase